MRPGKTRSAFDSAIATGKFDLRRTRRDLRADVTWGGPEDHIRELRRQVWRDLVERMEIRKAMSIKTWDELERQINDGEPPPIDVPTVQGMIDQFQADIPAMLEVAVKEVFEWLRPPRSEYKTNTEFEIGERVILRWMVNRTWSGSGWDVNYQREQNLVALENVFALLGGTVPAGGYYSALSTSIKECKGRCWGATPLFEYRGFRNGTLHLRFRRMDLVQKLNAIAGGARLKPTMEAA